MNREDTKHPAWMDAEESTNWESFKLGWEAATAAILKAAEEKEANTAAAPPPDIEFPDEKPPQFVRTPAGIMPKTCARCPNPKNPDPMYHDTGIAHTFPRGPGRVKPCMSCFDTGFVGGITPENGKNRNFQRCPNKCPTNCSVCHNPDCDNPGGQH